MWTNSQKTMDYFTITKGILNGKLHLMCSIMELHGSMSICKLWLGFLLEVDGVTNKKKFYEILKGGYFLHHLIEDNFLISRNLTTYLSLLLLQCPSFCFCWGCFLIFTLCLKTGPIYDLQLLLIPKQFFSHIDMQKAKIGSTLVYTQQSSGVLKKRLYS